MFSVNQNRQLYVVKAWKSNPLAIGESNLVPGDCYFGNDGKNYFFQYVNAKGEVLRSDLINPCKINYVRYTEAANMLPKAREYTVAVSDDIKTDGKVPAGKHYILRLNFSKMVGISDEERGMVFGDCYTVTATTAQELLNKLALSLVKNIAADKTGTALAEVKIGSTVVTPTTDLSSATGSLTITEVAQPWSRGKRQFAILPFTVSGNNITIDRTYCAVVNRGVFLNKLGSSRCSRKKQFLSTLQFRGNCTGQGCRQIFFICFLPRRTCYLHFTFGDYGFYLGFRYCPCNRFRSKLRASITNYTF